MRSTTFTTVLTLLLASATSASAIPLLAPAGPHALIARAPAVADCNALSDGITKHLAIQKSESQDVKELQKAADPAGFADAKAKLDADLAAGKTQKAANTAAAKKVGATEVSSILDAIGTAQVRVTELVGGLVEGDKAALSELADLFSAATGKNQDALKAAKAACKSAA